MHLFTKLFYKLRAFGSGVNRLLLKISVALYGNRQYLMHWSNRQLWLWKRLPYPEKCMLCHLKSALFVYDLCCKTKIIEAVIVYFWKKVIDNRVFLHCRYRLFYFCRYGLLYLCLHRIFYLSLSSSPSVCCFFLPPNSESFIRYLRLITFRVSWLATVRWRHEQGSIKFERKLWSLLWLLFSDFQELLSVL